MQATAPLLAHVNLSLPPLCERMASTCYRGIRRAPADAGVDAKGWGQGTREKEK
jgi:hypothetical protein